MWLPQVLFWIMLTIALLGCICLVRIFWHWRSDRERLHETWSKVTCELLQILSGTVSIFAAFASAVDKTEWFHPALGGIVSLGIWKFAQILIDKRLKDGDRADKQALERTKIELERAEIEAEIRTRLLTIFREAVDRKSKRIGKSVRKQGKKRTIEQIRTCLTPSSHLEELLESLAVFFQQQISLSEQLSHNFRVGLYVKQDDLMTPIHAINLQDPAYVPFSSFELHRERFHIQCEEKASQVVLATRQRTLLITEDCTHPQPERPFDYFNANQAGYLRSMIAYYMGEVCSEDGRMAEAVLAVDTNYAGFFKENARNTMMFVLGEFKRRLKLEMFLIAILSKREAKS